MIARELEAIRVITSNVGEIDEIWDSSNEFYFRFRGHVFSVTDVPGREPKFGRYSFYVYPQWSGSLETLAEAFDLGGSDVRLVPYHSGSYDEDTPFAELYSAIHRKYVDVDSVFDDIMRPRP